jgi:hypothetical protein
MGRYISETGTAATVVREVNSAYTAEVNDRILMDSSGGSFTITLPVSTSLLVNDTIQFIDVTSSLGTNSVTVDRNGALIQGQSDNLTLDVNGATITLMYSGQTYGWIVIGT